MEDLYVVEAPVKVDAADINPDGGEDKENGEVAQLETFQEAAARTQSEANLLPTQKAR